MDYYKLIKEAIEKKEVLPLLKGERGYEIEVSRFTSDIFPTDINTVLVNCFYKQMENIKEIDKIFVKSLYKLLEGNAVDIYIAILYYDACIFQEEQKRATFTIDKEILKERIRDRIACYEKDLRGEIIFFNGMRKKDAWKNIQRILALS
ncbi:MAG: hypothetical protein NC416_15830 [Eubacterium sp.]|nr:hypothetical protein [Eubacterium sp.]